MNQTPRTRCVANRAFHEPVPQLILTLLVGTSASHAQTAAAVAVAHPVNTPLVTQVIVPPMEKIHDPSVWRIVNRGATLHDEGGKKFVRFDNPGLPGNAWVVGTDFHQGILEVDLRGRNTPQQSFVGIAFRGVDEKKRDAVYFRTFNFQNPERRTRAVQYESRPEHPWNELRENRPGKYEAAVNPVPGPEDWFHVRIVVQGCKVSVYVNDSATPSLVVTELTDRAGGMVGLDGINADFANLKIMPEN